MKRKEILDLNFEEQRDLGNGHKLFSHELFTLMFIEKDGDYEVWKDDKSRLDIVRQFEDYEKNHKQKTK